MISVHNNSSPEEIRHHATGERGGHRTWSPETWCFPHSVISRDEDEGGGNIWECDESKSVEPHYWIEESYPAIRSLTLPPDPHHRQPRQTSIRDANRGCESRIPVVPVHLIIEQTRSSTTIVCVGSKNASWKAAKIIFLLNIAVSLFSSSLSSSYYYSTSECYISWISLSPSWERLLCFSHRKRNGYDIIYRYTNKNNWNHLY